MERKTDKRRRILSARRAMEPAAAAALSRQIVNMALSLLPLCDPEDTTLYLYAAIHQEANLAGLARQAVSLGYRIAYPAVAADGSNAMDFFLVNGPEELHIAGKYKIPEPVIDQKRLVMPDQRDIVFVPGAVFSRQGDRIGYGAGYYDSYFARFPEALRIGICYDMQIADAWEIDSHDIRMDAIVTENEEIVCDERFGKFMQKCL